MDSHEVEIHVHQWLDYKETKEKQAGKNPLSSKRLKQASHIQTMLLNAYFTDSFLLPLMLQ